MKILGKKVKKKFDLKVETKKINKSSKKYADRYKYKPPVTRESLATDFFR